MLKIEKTVFISYRRTNSYHALAIFQHLNANDYDVFIDFDGIDSGSFDQIILNQIKARAHFIVILTPSALEGCDKPEDWLRREILTAIEYKRNIVPVFFDGFDWKKDVVAQLPDVLKPLAIYNGFDVPSSLMYFETAMNLLQTKRLNIALDEVLHPPPPADVSVVEQKIAEATNQPAVTEKQLSAGEYFERAFQHSVAGRYDDAIRDYTEAIHLNPQYAFAYNNRGFIYATKLNFDHAIADFTEVIRLNSQDASTYVGRGLAYAFKKDYDRAIADFTEAILLNPLYAAPYSSRGLAYYGKKDYDRAIADYERALQINPNIQGVQDNLANAKRKKAGG
jgi:hypothetical protein